METRSIARCLPGYATAPETQMIQTTFRQAVAEIAGIRPGERILEIGCGQGEMTAVLAAVIGPEGRVVACDRAEGKHGAPYTLDEAATTLRDSPLGDRVKFCFGCDILADDTHIEGTFDRVVLSHCSWYFDSESVIRNALVKLRRYARTLTLSEWNLAPRTPAQSAHALAVLIRGRLEADRDRSEANIRTPIDRESLIRLVHESGWTPETVSDADSSPLQDGGWEIDDCLAETPPAEFTPRRRDIFYAETGVLRDFASRFGRQSLGSFVLNASRPPL